MAGSGPPRGTYISVVKISDDTDHDVIHTGRPTGPAVGMDFDKNYADSNTMYPEGPWQRPGIEAQTGIHQRDYADSNTMYPEGSWQRPAMGAQPGIHQRNSNGVVGKRTTRYKSNMETAIRVRKRWRSAVKKVIESMRGKRMSIHDTVGVLLQFLVACRDGDIDVVEELIATYPNIDLNNTSDAFGNSPLTLAVKNDDAQVVSMLKDKVRYEDWREALLMSITMDHDEISLMLIETAKYEAYTKRASMIAISTFEPKTNYPKDLTPLMLASIRNQYPVVRELLAKGETIERPHHAYCDCDNCAHKLAKADELEVAKVRLYAYKGLASYSYISLTSPDPLLEAFTLRQTLRENANIEKYFKAEYKKLASNLSDYSVKLLRHVRSGQELDVILRESTITNDRDRQARLKLAIRYDEKLFVTHPSCQKRIQYLWTDGWGAIQRKPMVIQMLWCLAFGLTYPIFALIYWIYPYGRVGKFLETPVVKFIGEAFYYLVFICILLTYTFTERASEGYTIAKHSDMGEGFKWYNRTTTDPEIADVFLRVYHYRIPTLLISVHILGYLWQIVKTLYRDRLYYFTDNSYNLMDITMQILLALSMSLRFYTTYKTEEAVKHFSSVEAWQKLESSGGSDGKSELYWLDADRASWRMWDTQYIAEAAHSYAVLPALIRATYILGVSETLGPLLISLKHMFKNFVIFMTIFLVVIIAFLVSFHNLYWYYDIETRREAETPVHAATQAEIHYGKLLPLMRTMMFTLFGMTDHATVEMSDDYKSTVTLTTAYFLFGAYNWISVIIFLNMLIGMMAKAYDTISSEKDMEWKFDRTKLYLDYMKEGNTLCVPFNIVPTWWSFRKCTMQLYVAVREETEQAPKEEKHVQKVVRHKAVKQKAPEGGYAHEMFRDDDGDMIITDNLADSASPKDTQLQVNFQTPESKIHKKKPVTKYMEVIEKLRERFITASTTPGEDEEGEENSMELFNQMKSEITQFRHDMAKKTARNDSDKKRIFAHLRSLEDKLNLADLTLQDIRLSCDDTKVVLREEIKPEVLQNLSDLREVNENVVTLKTDVNRKDEEVQKRLQTMTESTDEAHFAPIKTTLGTIEKGLEKIRAEEARLYRSAPRAPRRREKKAVAPADYDGDLEWEPFPVDLEGTNL